MKVSIILPSYNRYPLNLYTLYALEKQTFDLSKMEVILIDDASTDQTPKLKDFKATFHYVYKRNKQNLGLAATRNRGSEIAKGKILIFLDSEMLVDPTFVQCHYENHLAKENIVVVGGTERGKIFSYLFPEFDSSQIKRLTNLVKENQVIRDRITNKTGEKVDSSNISSIIKKLDEPVPLLTKKEIQNFSSLKPFISQTKNINKLLEYLGDNISTSPLAWMTSAGNISLKRQLFEDIGGYEEMFKGWGPEDAEFAYRLKKHGAAFVVDDRLRRYHQEHPKQTNRLQDDKKNWLIFHEKHPDLEVAIRALSRIGKKDYAFMDKILRENLALNKNFPSQFHAFEEALIIMLKQIRVLEVKGKPIKNLLDSSGASNNKEVIFKQRNQIASYKEYQHLIKLFDLLVNS